MHAAVHVDGAGNDGQLRMTMVEPSREAGLAVDILDYTAAKNGQLMIGPQAAGEGRTRQTVYVGETSRTNAEIADINNAGRGLALDTFVEPPFESEYYQGEADCVVFCQKMMEKLGVPANAFVDDMVKKNSQRIEALMAANREFKPAFRIDVSLRLRTALPGDEKINDVKEYNIRDDPKNPQLMQRPLQQDISATRYDDAGDPFADSKPIALPSQEGMLDFDNERVQASPWDTPLCERSLEARCDSAPRSKVVGSEVTFGRMRGVASTVTIIAPDVANALGAAAAAAQAVLVILDFVDNQWQHAALGAVVSVVFVNMPLCLADINLLSRLWQAFQPWLLVPLGSLYKWRFSYSLTSFLDCSSIMPQCPELIISLKSSGIRCGRMLVKRKSEIRSCKNSITD